MIEGKSLPWFDLYASAVLEVEPERLIERVDAAEAAIHGRLRDLQYDSDHHEERQLIEDAQRTLSFLRRCP
jgi:hypothetical protein